jgi:hypothetical protein
MENVLIIHDLCVEMELMVHFCDFKTLQLVSGAYLQQNEQTQQDADLYLFLLRSPCS